MSLYCQQASTVPSLSHYRNISISSLPVRLNSTPTKLLPSPLCARILSLLSPLIYLFTYRTMLWHSFISLGWKRDPNLLREKEVVPLEKVIYIPMILVCLIFIFPYHFLYSIGTKIKTPINYNIESKNEYPIIDIGSMVQPKGFSFEWVVFSI